ncbi:hypothetical protein M0802_015609 [Mischocyttarus mexicanus]|nr:hypothetical protein M0802_015609 [Mischocyttarus mexicanus]
MKKSLEVMFYLCTWAQHPEPIGMSFSNLTKISLQLGPKTTLLRMPTVVNSSLTYEILMYLNSFYFGMFAVCELGMGLFKAANLPSPGTSTTLTEFALLFFLIVTEGARIYLGRKGNLTERGLPILIGIFLTFPSSLATLYFLFWQNYVLKLEVILCSIQLVILALELIISVMYLIAIYRPPSPKE